MAGFIQVTSSKAISLLKSFCRKKLNLINGLHREDLELVRSRWKHINEICLYEETDYLPETTSKLILRLLEIRKLTYENSAIRFQEQYFDYDGEGVYGTSAGILSKKPFEKRKNIQITILYREMLMKISVQNPILPTVILHLVFSVWVAHVRNLLPWVLPSC